MKKIYLVFILFFCLYSFKTTNAESLIIPSTNTIDQYLEYRSGCSSNLLDCYSANSIENNAWSDVRGILNQIPQNSLDLRRVEDIKKARENLDKDNEANYKQLQDELKNINSSVSINQTIEESAQEEYEYQLRVYKLKAELACMDKEGYYSSFNFETKECECEEGSTFINGKCENELLYRLDNLLMCVQTFGPLAQYDFEKNGCMCGQGSEFDWNSNGLCTVSKEKSSGSNAYIPVAERQNNPTTKTLTSTEIEIPEQKIEIPMETTPTAEIQTDRSIPVSVPENQKNNLWQRLKISISKLKFW